MPKHPKNHNLYQNHLTWTFRFNWPVDVREAAGQREFYKSLQTQDLVTARFKRDRLLAECKLFVKEVREKQEREVKQQLAETYAGVKDDEEFRTMHEEEIFGHAVEASFPGGFLAAEEKAEAHGWDKTLRGYEDKIDQFTSEVTSGDISTPFNAYLKEFLEERRSKINERTLEDFELSISRFSKNFKTVGSVNTRDVRDWFRGLEKKLSTSRIRSINQHLHAYWIFLSEKEIVPDDVDPFKSIRLIEAKKTKGYEPFEVDDCVMLLDAAERKPDSQLADLILLVLYTGMRIEEACSLKTKDVKPDRLIITEGKTLAAEREIPIHSKFKPLLNVMIAESKDGYVISGITSKERHGKRHCAVGQRFGRMKDRLEFKKKYQCFHSFRKTVTTLLQQAGVDISVAADILGHQNPHFTWRVYSSGSSMQQKQDAIEKLEYPPLPELTKRRLDRIVPLSN